MTGFHRAFARNFAFLHTFIKNRPFNSFQFSTRFITQTTVRRSQEYYLAKSPKGENYRLNLAKSGHLFGIRTARGTRETNEDRHQALVLGFDVREGVHEEQNIPDIGASLHEEGKEGKEGQICYFAIFDGHGGPQCADYLTANLHKRIEDVQVSDADDVVLRWRDIGGYFRRFRPAVLTPLLSPETMQPKPRNRALDTSGNPNPGEHKTSREYSSATRHSSPPSSSNLAETSLATELTLDQRLTIAFLKTDLELLNCVPNSTGSTATAALIKSLDSHPFWSSQELEIAVAHVGDTRALLCDVPSGNFIPLTLDHHPNAITEHDRLRKSGGYIITDSFGSEMFFGRLANTRAMGDSKMKRYGISAEPEIAIKTVKGNDVAFMVLVSDGVTSVLSNQEIVDCIKGCDDPTLGASKLVDLADELGSEDNITAMVVRLPGWGSSMPDHTKDLRKYRLDHDARIKRRT